MPVLTENANVILQQRYKGPSDKDADDIFRRVAAHVAQAEGGTATEETSETATRAAYAEGFYQMMAALKFLPNSPTLRNAGAHKGCLSGCYVVPIDDTMHSPNGTETGIADAATAAIMIQKYGGGTGFSGGRLRPRGDTIQTTHKAACGPVEVLKYLNAASELVTQAAFRAGANMFILPVYHPDILEFIDCKLKDPDSIGRFNISIGITDDFMESYKEDGRYPLINPRTGRQVDTVSARDLMLKLSQAAWATGDPGIFNLSLANHRNPTSHKVKIEATNPCSEQTLPPWGSCTLGSIDVSKFVLDDGRFDIPSFRNTVKLAVRFLDDVITVNEHPLPAIQEQAENDRRIGLGLMGWHDFLILHGVPYASEAALAAVDQVGSIFQRTAEEASIELAEERGPYPWFEGSPRQKGGGSPIRNATRTNMAPTGTLSIIAGCSSGIEPRFGLANWRKYYDSNKGEFVTFPQPEVGQALEKLAKAKGFYSAKLVQALADGYSLESTYLSHIGEQIPPEILDILATATEISPDWHIHMQAAWQKYVDNAISKTINLPPKAQPVDVEKAFVMALGEGCVSTTVYRDGSRNNQVLTNGNPTEPPIKREAAPAPVRHGRERLPRTRPSITHKIELAGWEGYVTMGTYPDGRLGEIFIASKEGSTLGGMLDAWATTVSISLQYGVPLQELTQKMRNTRFEPAGITPYKEIKIATSIVDYVGHILEQTFLNGELPKPEHTGMVCDDCGGQMILQMGCHVCEACGNEKCG